MVSSGLTQNVYRYISYNRYQKGFFLMLLMWRDVLAKEGSHNVDLHLLAQCDTTGYSHNSSLSLSLSLSSNIFCITQAGNVNIISIQ